MYRTLINYEVATRVTVLSMATEFSADSPHFAKLLLSKETVQLAGGL